MELSIFNCFYLVLPVLIWNFIFASKLNQDIFRLEIAYSKFLNLLEDILRYTSFILPVLLPIKITHSYQETGIVLYLIGIMIYFISWLPLLLMPENNFSTHKLILFAPYVTPILFFCGISLLGDSILFFTISTLFVLLHFINGFIKFKLLADKQNLSIQV